MWTPASNIMGRGRGDGGGAGHNNMGGVAEMQMQRLPNWSTIQQQQCNMPVNQNMYQNIPHEQIDWAALAQQWIQMRETGPGGVVVDIGPPGPHFQGVHHGMHERLPPHHLRMANAPLIPPVVHVPHSRPHQPPPPMASVPTAPQHPMVRPPRDMVGVNTSDNSNSQDIYDTGGEWSSYWSGPQQWGPNAHPHSHQHGQQAQPNWAPPPAERKIEGPGSFDYGGHMHGNHGFAPQTYDYNHGTDHIGLPQGPVQGSEPAQFSCPSGGYWASSGPAAPPFLRRDMSDFVDQIPPGGAIEEDLNAMPTLDAAKRKNLPAWIRDGLEKMEREKQKKLEREEMLKQRELRLEAQREEEEKAVREFHARAGDDGDIKVESSALAAMPSKSKFESDSEGADDSDDERVESDSETRSGSTAQRGLKSSQSPKSRTPTPPPFEPLMREQERMEAMMAKVRRLLTEILLEVTNEEIESISKEVFSKARAKAPARQLAKSSALASITGNLGLGGYSSGSDDSEGSGKDDPDEEDDDDGEDSDAELQEKIHRRRLEFAQREKEFTYGDDTSLESSHDVRGDEDDSANDSEGRKGGFEDSAEKDEVKSKARSDFEKKWYSSDVQVEEKSIGGATNETSIVGYAESSETFSGGHAAQGESKRSTNQNDDDNGDGAYRVKRSSDARQSKRSVSERDSRSRSRSRDRGGGDGESNRRSSHRSQPRRSSRTPERRDRGSSRDRLERARTTGHAAENRRRNRSTRSRSVDRSRRRRSRTRSRDREYRGRRGHQRSSSSSSSSSSSGASRKAESRNRQGSSRRTSTTTSSRRGRNDSGSRKRRSESTSSVSSSSSRRKKKTSTTSMRSSSSNNNNVNKTDSRSSSSKHRGSSSKSEATTGGRSRNK